MVWWSGFKLLCHCLINSQKVFASASPQFLESACTSNMKYLLSSVYCATFLAVSGAEHDHYHHADQMPWTMSNILLNLCTVPVPAKASGIPLRLIPWGLFHLTVTADAIFSGITTFAKLPWVQCLTKEKGELFDIAFIGEPFVSLLTF